MSVNEYHSVIDYFYEAIKSNRGPLVAEYANDVSSEDSKGLRQIANEASEEFDKSKVKEIENYLVNSDYIDIIDYSTRYMLIGITPEGIKKDLENEFIKKPSK